MPREVRVASNQALFEKVRRVEFLGWRTEPVHINCECQIEGCATMILVSFDTYERIRSAGRYIVAPGHEAEAKVIESHPPSYSIVEVINEVT
jgi:hypothetical protein